MHPLESYLREIHETYATGAVPETSYYPALATLLNSVGRTLSPRVRCTINPANRGAGIPDGGLFTADQFRRATDTALLSGLVPARGVIEVKPPKDDTWVTAEGTQVTRYWGRYGQVLVTNLRDFLIVGTDREGRPIKLETYRLTDTEVRFWAAAASPTRTVQVHGDRFIEYLKRVLSLGAPLRSPLDLASLIASYARDALIRVDGAGDLPALATIRTALEETLGMKFEGKKGDHFFRSSLVQTLFYGVFAAWVLWSKRHPPTRSAQFDWRLAVWELRVPMIQLLFQQVATPMTLGPLDLVEVLDWTNAALSRVDRDAFFQEFEQAHAVQYFYEPFLEAFDPELRKQLGVWYTPHEVVEYMVERVDTALREEMGLPDGLATPEVYVLDPATGTGSYLVAVLNRVAATLRAKGEDALLATDVKRAAMQRVFGFELLPAPFVVAHLQLGLLLQDVGAPLSERPLPDGSYERVGVYLTNSLTGWGTIKGPRLPFREMQEERDASSQVKTEAPILVILGNPPYDGFAGVSPKEEDGLLDAYKHGLRAWGITKHYLANLYVRFIRMAERRIVERTGKGVLCYITPFSYLSDPSFVVMRQHLLEGFDNIWIDSLNGDSRWTGKLTPDGKPDPSVFSTPYHREGIQVGTSVSLLVRKEGRNEPARIRFRQFWGVSKRADLVASLAEQPFGSTYQRATPDRANRYSFRPVSAHPDYGTWPSLADLAAIPPLLGLNDNRAQATFDILHDEIRRRMRAYYDPTVPFSELRHFHRGLVTNASGFNAEATRARLIKESAYGDQNIRPFFFRPFDLRWAYVERMANLWNRIRPELLDQAWNGNEFILSRRRAPRAFDGAAMYFGRTIADQHVLHKDAYFFPLRLRPRKPRAKEAAAGQHDFLAATGIEDAATTANLSTPVRAYLMALGLSDPDQDSNIASLIWMHALAIGYAPAYLTENADRIQMDWARVPLPADADRLLASAALGRRVGALLDVTHTILGVTGDPVRPELAVIGVVAHTAGKALDPATDDLAVEVGWGHVGQDGIVMPGHGKVVERPYTAQERAAIEQGARTLGMKPEQAFDQLGTSTLDLYLNNRALWRNVPTRIWRYTIGGFPVLKKWLSYRERAVLGRALAVDETREFRDMARRLAGLVLLEPLLDDCYRKVAGAACPWSVGAPTVVRHEPLGHPLAGSDVP